MTYEFTRPLTPVQEKLQHGEDGLVKKRINLLFPACCRKSCIANGFGLSSPGLVLPDAIPSGRQPVHTDVEDDSTETLGSVSIGGAKLAKLAGAPWRGKNKNKNKNDKNPLRCIRDACAKYAIWIDRPTYRAQEKGI
ncbi:hypothetical protein PAAG_03582 [Paracoccidioides lutzii Pb01]|uniref:Uncharacterized protein n=1 Tax=Paracoccidioides lutzii (strain ATCC MYA-826 / Pb01) TaxID=502779 RepID=C1GXK8_PARBA|nr:hypothetical protein PAAG_03582 [Paracoccidioides lutzii Pb01]EEH41296.2 hypothetical protein PAAG_03582 [Paracoccidioides lutzii Pb01]